MFLLLLCLFSETVICQGAQRYDGWYNNLANPVWGGVGDGVVHKTLAQFADMTYEPSGSNRPNPRVISNNIFNGSSGLPSYANRTTLFAYFGQFVSAEILLSADPSCPVELLRVPLPENDQEFRLNGSSREIPFIRSDYLKGSGEAPNNPRKPLNKATAWIDGSFLYGHGEVWANCLRAFKYGKLSSQGSKPEFPALNKFGLPLDNYPNPTTHQMYNLNKMWMFGDKHSHQSPAFTAIALLWFGYHNKVAEDIRQAHKDWDDEKIFQTSRRWVVAVMQNIIVNEWLPVFLNESLPEYTGYKNHIQPSISTIFESAAFRIGHSHIPPGIYSRDESCNYGKPLRLCNTYFRSHDIFQNVSAKNLLLGLSSQIAEREDHIIVEDLRGKCFGPLHFSRQDLCVMTIMRGRDHGLTDYNSARAAYGLPKVVKWEHINPEMYKQDPEPFIQLRLTYKDDIDSLDVYPAGILESSPSGPGPLFMAVIKDQFQRIRDADRFWFESKEYRYLSKSQVQEIKQIKLSDVIKKTFNIKDDEIQDNVFIWHSGDPCPQPKQLVAEDMSKCTPHKGYDYFSGSELSYITAFTCLGLVPFVCILVAVIIAKCKRFQLKKTKEVYQQEMGTAPTHAANSIPVCEWLGYSLDDNPVDLKFDMENCCLITLASKKVLRTLDLKRQEVVATWVANDKRRNTILIHVPKEYDLVLVMNTEEDKEIILVKLKEMLQTHNHPLHIHQCKTAYIFEKAVTKEKRQILLTKFFRGVFAEAFNVKEIRPTDELQIEQCKEIVTCELSRSEFADALALKPDSMFVSQMFNIIDRDHNGYISFRELLYAVLLFTKGSCEDKMKLLFTMYDQDKSGSLSRLEIREMIRSMMEMANSDTKVDQIEALVDSMFENTGLDDGTSLTFEDFSAVFSDKLDMLWDVCLDWKGISPSLKKNVGTKLCMPKKKGRGENSKVSGVKPEKVDDAVEPQGSSAPTEVSIIWTKVRHYIENHRQHIFYLLLFYSICVLVFSEKFYYYSVEQEHKGFRSLAGDGVSLTRGAAAGMSFTFSLLLLTMCRNSITKLRETFINLYIPFDSHVEFHKWVAYTALAFTVIHILGYCFNFYHIATQPVPFLCIFDEIHFRSDAQPKFHFWLFQNLTGLTGVLLVIVIAIIYVFATQISRVHIFNAFWITHKFIYVLYILILLHGSSRVIQDPHFWYYFIWPATLFTIDKMVSLARAKRQISVVRAELLPSDVTLVEFKRPHNFEYRSGQWVRLAVQTLGREEYHSFTLTSAPHEDTLSVHIRSLGPWTWNIRRIFNPDILRDQPFPKVYIDGAYGAGQQDWYKYDVSVLVGGGIGVTPYASILKDFVFMAATRSTFKLKCQKLYFVWVTASQKHFEWLVDILKTVEEHDKKDVVETHIFITKLFQEFDLRTTMMYICEQHFQKLAGKSIFTGLSATTHFGRPKFDYIFDAVRDRHPKVKKVGVFSCGPPGLTKGVQKACYDANTKGKAFFEHHFENF